MDSSPKRSPQATNDTASPSNSNSVIKVAPPTWDPLSSPDWDKESHTKHALLRIKRDLQTIYMDPPPGICVVPSGDDLTKLHAIITGPFDTPYEGGLFHFYLRFPPNYPLQSPRIKFMTTGGGMIRFNPNLYNNGKVCLSILGTAPGPSWSAVQSLQSILLSIQSVLNDKPHLNVPGYQPKAGEFENYHKFIIHETLRVAVCGAIENNQAPQQLLELKKTSFLEFYDYYLSTAKRLSAKLDGQVMHDLFGFNKGIFNFGSIVQNLQALHDKLSQSKKA